ncbi:MAG: molybdopterin dinucleotide binding domain-containing protein [Candidatus Hydrothermarchaeales archaeon]
MLKVTLTTGRSISQGQAKEGEKALDSYTNSAAICEFDPTDMKKLGAKEGDTIRVRTSTGEVALKAVLSKQAPHKGLIFVPIGPWANAVTDYDTSSTGMPSLKGIEAEVELAKDLKVLGAVEFVRERYLKYKK